MSTKIDTKISHFAEHTGSYRCAQCGGVFEKERSDAEAMEESLRTFGEIPQQDRAVICDDCYKALMANFN